MDKIIMIIPVNATWAEVKDAADKAWEVLQQAKRNPSEATINMVPEEPSSITALISDIEKRVGALSLSKIDMLAAQRNFSVGVIMGKVKPHERIRIASTTDPSERKALEVLGLAWLPGFAKALGNVFEQNF